jgi:hypothetical protein
VPGVREHGAVGQRVEHLIGDDAGVPRGGDEELAPLGEAAQVVDAVAVERGLERRDLVDLGHGHATAERPQVLRDAPPAPAVAGHHEPAARDHQVGDPHDALDDRLPHSVPVLADRLERAVVDDDGRERHEAGELGAQADAAARRLLGAAGHRAGRPARHHAGGEVAAVVEQDVGHRRHHGGHVRLVLLECVVATPEHGHAGVAQVRHDVVLRRPVVAGRHDLGTARGEHLEQHRGLRLDVQRHAHAAAGERLPFGEIAPGVGEQRHPGPDPGGARRAAFEEFRHVGSLSYMNAAFAYGNEWRTEPHPAWGYADRGEQPRPRHPLAPRALEVGTCTTRTRRRCIPTRWRSSPDVPRTSPTSR